MAAESKARLYEAPLSSLSLSLFLFLSFRSFISWEHPHETEQQGKKEKQSKWCLGKDQVSDKNEDKNYFFLSLPFPRLSRQTGIRQEEELETPDSLFEEVTEEEYAQLIHERQRDNFVLDDGTTNHAHNSTHFYM